MALYITVTDLVEKEDYHFILRPTFGLGNYDLYWEKERGVIIGNALELPEKVWEIVKIINIEYKKRPLKNGVREFGQYILEMEGVE